MEQSKPMELPKEWKAKIQKDGCQFAGIGDGIEVSSFRNGMYSGYQSGAMGYAPWLYTCQTNYAALQAKCEQAEQERDRKKVAYEMMLKTAEKYFAEIGELKAKCERYEKALKVVQKWQLPATGNFWDKEQKEPMSYGACYGSNGERYFMRNVANEALAGDGGRICPKCDEYQNQMEEKQ
jgi:hypothetical protein